MINHLIAETFGVEVSDPKVVHIMKILDSISLDERRLSNLKRNRDIYDLRARGMKVREIGERFGLTRQTCHEIIKAELERRRKLWFK